MRHLTIEFKYMKLKFSTFVCVVYSARGRAMAARLRNLVILSRDAAKTVEFFNRGLQLPVVFSSPTMTELDAGSGIPLIVRSAAR